MIIIMMMEVTIIAAVIMETKAITQTMMKLNTVKKKSKMNMPEKTQAKRLKRVKKLINNSSPRIENGQMTL